MDPRGGAQMIARLWAWYGRSHPSGRGTITAGPDQFQRLGIQWRRPGRTVDTKPAPWSCVSWGVRWGVSWIWRKWRSASGKMNVLILSHDRRREHCLRAEAEKEAVLQPFATTFRYNVFATIACWMNCRDSARGGQTLPATARALIVPRERLRFRRGKGLDTTS